MRCRVKENEGKEGKCKMNQLVVRVAGQTRGIGMDWPAAPWKWHTGVDKNAKLGPTGISRGRRESVKLLQGNSDYEGFSAGAAIAKSSSNSNKQNNHNHEVEPVTGSVDAGRRSENSFFFCPWQLKMV